MARMSPNIISPDTRSEGERKMFNLLRDDPGSKDWTVLHSIDIPRHINNVTGEADFVIIVPGGGILILEVKGYYNIRRDEGMWYYGHDSHGDPRGPFKQAREAMYSIKAFIKDQRKDLSRLLVCFAVVTPFTKIDPGSVAFEWKDDELISIDDFSSGRVIKKLLAAIESSHKTVQESRSSRWYHPEDSRPTVAHVGELYDLLRPNFTSVSPGSSRGEDEEEEVALFTNEQSEALYNMYLQPRILYTGPAGTGKTFMACESAIRRPKEEKVLVLCFNKNLSFWLVNSLKGYENITVSTVHKFMIEISRINIEKYDRNQEFWDHDLPRKAKSIMSKRKKDEKFDYLVVDEVQDMFIKDYLVFIDSCLKGGLAGGSWSFFGDFENQAVIKELDTRIEDLEDEVDFVSFSLRKNCRNTPRIVSNLEVLTNLSPKYNGTLRLDNRFNPDLLFYSSKEGQCKQLVRKLEELYGLGYRGNDITVLSTTRHDPVPERKLGSKWRARIKEYSTKQNQYVQWTTIHSFKGLESPAIIITDIERISGEKAMNLLYVGMSRAFSNLTLLISEDLRSVIKKILLSL